ncbi:hypothetical protein ACFXKC_18195 [Streptomyces sp. NPDC059340]|uniref:hypothetical protein n=1 Tax=Streptomyces sp. NPDC059340 TaxID=3346806 RepID=UPI003699E837
MADEDGAGRDDEAPDTEPQTEIRMELRDSLPGGRAVIGVEQEGEFVWLASKKHVTEQARDEFLDQFQRIVREGWWVQNWSGR